MEDRITIIEGPPPVFEETGEAWATGLNESPGLHNLSLTRLRTHNGPALVERCHRTWTHQEIMFLHYRNRMGLEEKVPILAARTVNTNEGDMLLLWVRVEADEDGQPDDPDLGGEG
jgi:hypothetical protein